VPGRIEIDDVHPVVSRGTFPAKAVVGEIVPVRATVWREGHDAVAATLFYRRRIEDMPLGEIPEDADAVRRHKFEMLRKRILTKAMHKYCFAVRPQHVPTALLATDDRLLGLRFQETTVVDGRAVAIADAVHEVHAPLVISSIGSIPEPMRGIPQDGALFAKEAKQRGSDAKVSRETDFCSKARPRGFAPKVRKRGGL